MLLHLLLLLLLLLLPAGAGAWVLFVEAAWAMLHSGLTEEAPTAEAYEKLKPDTCPRGLLS
jgi:hypothetical protein